MKNKYIIIFTIVFVIASNILIAQDYSYYIKNIKGKVSAYVFVSNNLTEPYDSIKIKVLDILKYYETTSDGKLHVEKYENKTNDFLESEASIFGVRPVQCPQIENDKLIIKNIVGSIVFAHNEKKLILSIITSSVNLDNEINKILFYFTLEKNLKIGFIKGHKENDILSNNDALKYLPTFYDYENIYLDNIKSIPKDINVLVIAGPKEKYSETDKYLVDQYILNGGNVVFLIDKIAPNFDEEIIKGDLIETNLDDLLLNYGIEINKDLICDLQCSYVKVKSELDIDISINYPYFPVFSNINKDVLFFDNINSVVLFFVSSININYSIGNNIKILPLLITSKNSGVANAPFYLNLEQFLNMSKEKIESMFNLGEITAGVVLTGKFTSFYKNKDNFIFLEKEDSNISGIRLDESIKESKIVIIGCSNFTDGKRESYVDNSKFIATLIEYLSIK